MSSESQNWLNCAGIAHQVRPARLAHRQLGLVQLSDDRNIQKRPNEAVIRSGQRLAERDRDIEHAGQ